MFTILIQRKLIFGILLFITPSMAVFAANMYESYNCITGQKENFTTTNWESVEETPSYPGNGRFE